MKVSLLQSYFVRRGSVLIGVVLSVAPQGVRLLLVNGVVSDFQLLVRHPQRDDEANQDAYDRRRHDVPPDDTTAAGELLHQLHPSRAAVYGASGVGDGEEKVAKSGLGEKAGEKAAEQAGDGVGVEDA
ncbi:unnamed protein product [Cuscuta epithymum]|uniref:Uncharacterized protein n=1 Tax=Cuscuta epithymum TaxID=186058 RepID=A0AAV0G6D8_9ASTE|nr:unnamed protein product [Cuscuta epithymum]